MTNIAKLKAQLTDLAQIEESELLTNQLETYIYQALAQHDKNATPATLEPQAEEPVLTLAWAKVCMVRASKYAKEAQVTGGSGYGTDPNSPYNKCVSLAKSLTQRYYDLVRDLRLSKSAITVGNLYVRDQVFDAMVPMFSNPNMPSTMLSVVSPVDENGNITSGTDIILKWQTDYFQNFLRFALFTIAGDEPIYEEWNISSATSYARVNDAATLVKIFTDPTARAIRITGVDRTANQRFLLVTRSRSAQFSYSNEITIPKV